MPILASDAVTTWKKIQWQNVTPSRNRTWASHSLWFQVQHYPFYTNWTFACKTETLGSLYSYALFILTESPKSKNQVVHEQKFKDLLSSTCQVSVERRVWTWNQRSWEAWVLFPLGVTFCHWILFQVVKPLMPIFAWLPISSSLWKTCVFFK